jgi:hypothetical protein
MLTKLELSNRLRRKIDQELEAGETIEWMDQPIPRFFTLVSITAFLFGIPWTAFALFWMWLALGAEIPDFSQGLEPQHILSLFGLPFVFIGLGMLSSPFWTWRKAKNTVYLITNRRAICIEGGWYSTIRSYYPDRLHNLYRKEKSDGSGDVVIAIRRWRDSNRYQRIQELGFLGIRNPQEAERMLQQLAKRAP